MYYVNDYRIVPRTHHIPFVTMFYFMNVLVDGFSMHIVHIWIVFLCFLLAFRSGILFSFFGFVVKIHVLTYLLFVGIPRRSREERVKTD